ncbi:MAG: MATE family efflux transporter [Chitinophagales bacterium]
MYKQKSIQAIKLALPIIAGQLGQVLMGVFDNIQIGGLGSEYIAAVGFSNNVYWVITLLGMGVLFSVSPLVSEAFGEQKAWKSIGVFRSGIVVAIVVSLLISAITYMVIQHIEIFQQAQIINENAFKYIRILNVSTIALILYTCGKQFTDGMGKTMVGMVLSIGGLLLNIALNAVLIYGRFGFPKMGIEGAALATSISRVLMTIAIFVYIWRNKKIKKLRQEYRVSPDKDRSFVLPILRLGIPAGLQFFFEVAAFSFTQIMSGWIGVGYLAAHQIAISLASSTFMVATGLSAAGTIMTGFAYGAKDKEGARIAGNTIFLLTTGLEVIFLVLFLILHSWLPKIYTDDPAVLRIASTLVILAALFQLSDGLQAAGAGVLRGVQDVKFPSVLAFISYWGIMVPLGYVLAFKTGLGVNGLWVGFIVGLSIAAVLLMLRFRWKVRRLQFQDL